MQHLTEEQLIAHYYHDGDTAFAEEHLAVCDECRAQFETLHKVLDLVDQLPIPERGMFWHARTQQNQTPQAIVAHATPAPAAQPAAIGSASKDRLLLVVVSDHLDSSERMLLELANADAKYPLDVTSESKRAGELVASNRIYRQTATRRGETRIASLLSDLEPVLVELSHAGSTLSPDEIAALQKRIDSKGLLFKVRVVSAQVGGHEAPANVPQKGIDSL